MTIDASTAPTTAGDLRLQPTSPAIDAGNDDYVRDVITTDLDGNPRIDGAHVDMGAYELQDASPPVITATVEGTLGQNGWYVSDVSVTWRVEDEESAITDQSN